MFLTPVIVIMAKIAITETVQLGNGGHLVTVQVPAGQRAPLRPPILTFILLMHPTDMF